MNWIRTYDFKWVNLDFVSIIAYREIYIPDTDFKEIAGYRIYCEMLEETVDIGCLMEEEDAVECIDSIVRGKPHSYDIDLCSEEEIREIHERKMKKS
jgi:hypothetical protein